MNKKRRGEVIEALKKSVERCERLIAGLKENLAMPKLSKADRELMESELKRHSGMLDTRRSQLYQIEFVDKPYTSELSQDAARDLEDALEEQTADIWRDLDTVFFKHAQLNRERAKVHKLKANLKARKDWIAEYEAKSAN